jgi:hypothetical protein
MHSRGRKHAGTSKPTLVPFSSRAIQTDHCRQCLVVAPDFIPGGRPVSGVRRVLAAPFSQPCSVGQIPRINLSKWRCRVSQSRASMASWLATRWTLWSAQTEPVGSAATSTQPLFSSHKHSNVYHTRTDAHTHPHTGSFFFFFSLDRPHKSRPMYAMRRMALLQARDWPGGYLSYPVVIRFGEFLPPTPFVG